MTRIAVLDDHPIVWRAVQAAVHMGADFQFVGHAPDGTGLEGILQLDPDLLLLDIRLGTDDGFAVCERAVHLRPQLRVVIFTAHGNPSLVVRALNAGAVGYVLKDTDLPALIRAMRAVRDTGSYIDPRLAAGALGFSQQPGPPLLTGRELEILPLIVKGATNREIADILVLSPHTVKYHVENIKSKLGARRRTDIVRLAADRMLV